MRFPRILACVLAMAALAAPCGAAAQAPATPQQFLEAWGAAWDSHNVESMVHLYADDCTTVNRFGVIARGKDEIRRSLTWLHNGPFHTAHFAAPKLLDQRKVGSLSIVHASWKNPSGRADPAEDDLVLTLVLRDYGADGLVAQEVDTVTVTPIAPGLQPESDTAKP